MELLTQIENKIEEKTLKLGVIGLGFVGLPVASEFANKGFQVLGIEKNKSRVNAIQKGENPIKGFEPELSDLLYETVSQGNLKVTTCYSNLSECDVCFINVDTPIDENHEPLNLSLESACSELAKVMTPGTIVVVESTVAPWTTKKLVNIFFESNPSLVYGIDFFLVHCPERVMPGKLLSNLRTLDRVVGCDNPKVADTVVKLYKNVVEANIVTTTLVTAELVKTSENALRDVNIAFANEVARICEIQGANVWEVRELVNKSPERNMLLPGPGVGGHCIPKDPWLLLSGLDEDFKTGLISKARQINDDMPNHVLEQIFLSLPEFRDSDRKGVVTVLGMSYLENSDDLRNSPSQVLVNLLKSYSVKVYAHDPLVSDYQEHNVECIASKSDVLVIMVCHDLYREIDWHQIYTLNPRLIVIDTRNCDSKKVIEASGLRYKLLGLG